MIIEFVHIFLVAILLNGPRIAKSQQQQQQQQNSIKREFTYTLDDGYPIGDKLFGNIAGVDVDNDNNVIIFHRGSHKWDANTFNSLDVYNLSKDSPIPEETVITIDPKEKRIIRAWGKNLFFMPHGLSLDLEGKNVWLTDVALHQVFKYPLDGSSELLVLGTQFVPGYDEAHFCKPTSVADTGDFVFVADGYCNSRVVMFSNQGKYLGEFGQSTEAALFTPNYNIQPTFSIPHKITYAPDAKMLCVADRENGRIQCFSFEPRHKTTFSNGADPASLTDEDKGLLLNGAIKQKFIIADPLFNSRLFSIDYCPIRGGIIVAVSGESLYSVNKKPALGFVYNVTTGQLISRFAPPAGQTFGMAHDLAVTGADAESLYVVDISPVHLWRFSRPIKRAIDVNHYKAMELTKMATESLTKAMSIMREKDNSLGAFWYLLIFFILVALVLIYNRSRKISTRITSNSNNPFLSLYSSSNPTSINSLFGNSRPYRRTPNGVAGSTRTMFTTMFSRRAFFNLFERGQQQQQNDFSRIPLEDSDNSDDDKSDSDVEEFNINQANPSVKINV